MSIETNETFLETEDEAAEKATLGRHEINQIKGHLDARRRLEYMRELKELQRQSTEGYYDSLMD